MDSKAHTTTIPLQQAFFKLLVAFLLSGLVSWAYPAETIPPLERLKPDHPRLLVRPEATPWAISLAQLRSGPKNEAYRQMLSQLRGDKSAAAQAMVWLLTGDNSAADKAISTMRKYRFPGDVDTFHVYFTLTQFGLAYDWLYGYAGFTPEIRKEIRSKVLPLAEHGLKNTDDHMFHNYIWMSAGGVALWAMAVAGEDEAGTQLCERIRVRFNTGLFPAWKYLDGLPSEPMGYWSLYVLTPGALTLVAAQSAFETDVFGHIQKADGDWLTRHFENVIHSTLPDMRYVPWGDLQGGPNGGVTFQMAGIMDALTWATRSAHGAYFGDWLSKKRNLRRFYGDSAIFYFLYNRQLDIAPIAPPLSFLAGTNHSGHFIARSGWDDNATIVTFRCTDHFGDHHHYDQGSFIIYRQGLLAVDPPVYKQVRGPQQPTVAHNTLLLGGQGQRPVPGQWFKTIADFQKNLNNGRQLETGDILFFKESGSWAAVAGQFAQAYASEQVQSCVRQILFLRPGKILVVDQLTPSPGARLSEVQWLLQVPQEPIIEGQSFRSANGKSWLRCVPLSTGGAEPNVETTSVNTHRVSISYKMNSPLKLVHLLETGDGLEPTPLARPSLLETSSGLQVTFGNRIFSFSNKAPFDVTSPD